MQQMQKIIDGWIVKQDMDGNCLFNSHINPKDYYMVTIIKNYAIECNFLKEEIDSLTQEEKEKFLLDKIKMTIFEYGRKELPWEWI